MIQPDDFEVIRKAIEDGESITNESAQELIYTILEMDTNLVILQNGLELGVQNTLEIIPIIAERILEMSGRTDSKTKKKAAKYAAEITARYEVSIQLYLAEAADKARQMLEEIKNNQETNPTVEATNEASE